MAVIEDLARAIASVDPRRLLPVLVGVGVVVVIVAWRRRWDRLARRHPGRTFAAGLMALALSGPLAWYLGSPLFLSTTIDEPLPVAAGESPRPAGSPMASVMVEDPSAAPSSRSPSLNPSPSMTIAPTAPPLQLSGLFVGADDFHFGRGVATILAVGDKRSIVRLEDFAVRNGPDLYVYLSPAAEGGVDGAIELGRLKADRGNQNYDIPAGTDLSAVKRVVIWCKQFSVLFATAALS